MKFLNNLFETSLPSYISFELVHKYCHTLQKQDRPQIAKVCQEMKKLAAQNGEMLSMVRSLHVTWTQTLPGGGTRSNKPNKENHHQGQGQGHLLEEKLEERLLDKGSRRTKKDIKVSDQFSKAPQTHMFPSF